MTTVRPSVRETSLLLADTPPRVVADIRFIDQVANDEITNVFTSQASPANVHGVALHGLVQSGTFALIAPADKAGDIARLLLACQQNTRAVLRALSTQRQIGLGSVPVPDTIRAIYPGDVVRFNDVMPQGVAIVVLNMNNPPGSPTYPNTGISVADAKFGASPLIRWFLRDPGPQSRIDYIRTPFRVFNIDTADTAPAFGPSGAGLRFISPTARTLTLRFISSGLSRLTTESCGFALWWRDMYDGYWMHHPDDDMVAGRRGLIDASHDVETYAVPGTADMFGVVKVSGPITPKLCYSVMDADP